MAFLPCVLQAAHAHALMRSSRAHAHVAQRLAIQKISPLVKSAAQRCPEAMVLTSSPACGPGHRSGQRTGKRTGPGARPPCRS